MPLISSLTKRSHTRSQEAAGSQLYCSSNRIFILLIRLTEANPEPRNSRARS